MLYPVFGFLIRTFTEVQQEVKDWIVLPENKEEIVVVYLAGH